MIVLIVVGAVGLLGLMCCGAAVAIGAFGGDPLGPSAKTIRFEVTTTSGTATLVNWSTLEDSGLLRDVPATSAAPWVHEATLESKFGLVGVNASATSGLVSCRLLVDGVVVDEGESEGTVNCSATVR